MGISITEAKIVKRIIDSIFPGKDLFSVPEIFTLLEEMKDYQKYFGSQNKVKYQVHRDFVEYLMHRNTANYDTMVLITGLKGTGKSSAAISLGREWCKIMDIKFDPRQHIAYTNEQVMERIDHLPKFHPLICDESINFASSEDWNKAENKELKKKLGVIRTKHLFFILCFPLKKLKLDKTYRESYVNYSIDLYRRGKGSIFIRDDNPAKETWNMKYFEKMASFNEFTDDVVIKDIMKRHPNFWKMLVFPKLPEKVYLDYLKVRESNIYEKPALIHENITEEDLARALLIQVLNDVVLRDKSMNPRKMMKHLQDTYGVSARESKIKSVILDAAKKVEAMKASA